MSQKLTWMLKRFARFIPGSTGDTWKVFEAGDFIKPEMVLTIDESGHMLVWQGEELLEGISLNDASGFLKVQKKSDHLIFRCAVKGETRVMRLQFGGGTREEAVERCSSAVVKLMEYMPVTYLNDTSLPACAPPPSHALTVNSTTQERRTRLPLAYRPRPLLPGNLQAFLRVCLLDARFPAFVEEVEGEMKKALQG